MALALASADDQVVSISAGASSFACAAAGSGAVYCWGDNRSGELGDGSVEPHPLPKRVSGHATFVSVHAGDEMACALGSAGDVQCWGRNESGELGVGDTLQHRTPTRVLTPATFSQLSVGAAGATCGTTPTHSILCWGENGAGELGVGDRTPRATPTPIHDPTEGGYLSVSVGNAFACAVAVGGRVFCWGANNVGQLGIGRTPRTAALPTRPVQLPADESFTDVSAGFQSACALAQSGKLYCWGSNASGQLGRVATASFAPPAVVQSDRRFRSLSVGGGHACAISSDAQLFCWGNDLFGQEKGEARGSDDGGVRRIRFPTPQ